MDEPKGLIHFSKTPVSVEANHSNKQQILVFSILTCVSLVCSIFYFELIFLALICLVFSFFAFLRFNGISSIPLAVNLNHPFMEAGAVDNSEIMVRFTDEWIDPGIHRLKIVKDPVSGILIHKQDGEHSILSIWDTNKNLKSLSKQLAIINQAISLNNAINESKDEFDDARERESQDSTLLEREWLPEEELEIQGPISRMFSSE
tara:strand:- start:46887 stop:47498 length:612 start_codon:yes stop_codon:yes gene_type:complete